MNRHRNLVLMTFTLFMTVATVPGYAAGLGFLKETPLYYFGDADRKLMNEAVQAVLNDASGEAAKEWRNPRNGYSGKVQGTGLFKSEDGLDCRKLKIWMQARGVESESTYPVCRANGGDWRLAAGKELNKVHAAP
ncbi:RT0821/Lpp0805 family surface protein [Povalibacter sp.]|uniref:RT0821/Lpp0805 family surface protein n=1 Tax=Povalibacter sp. TaxID=1962978 RepID=UPI002F41DE18